MFTVEEKSESKLDRKRDVTPSCVIKMLVNSNFVEDDCCSVTARACLNCYCKLMGVTGLAYFSMMFCVKRNAPLDPSFLREVSIAD